MATAGVYRGFGCTDVGRRRDHNEDTFAIDESLNVYIVSDGVGGHAAGEVASAATVDIILRELRANRDVLDDFIRDATFYHRARATDVLESAIETANRQVYRMAGESPERFGMAATVAVLLLLGPSAIVAHVGDSRVYIHRDGEQHQLTLDHSFSRLQLRLGVMSREEADLVGPETAITRAIGAAETVQVDTLHLELMPGDTFLLCSDGLSDYFLGDEFSEALRGRDLEKVPSYLVGLANKVGGKDNITAVVVEVVACEAMPEDATVVRKIEALRTIPLFATLSYREIVILLEAVQVREYPTGKRILTEGEEGDELFVVLSGTVHVSRHQQPLARLTYGGFFGEMSLIDSAPRSADVDAVERCTVMVIRREDFDRLIGQNPVLGVKLLRGFCREMGARLRATSREVGELLRARVPRPGGT